MHPVAAAALFVLIAWTTPSPPVLPATAAQSGMLRIVVIEGEDAVNIVQQETAIAPVVEAMVIRGGGTF